MGKSAGLKVAHVMAGAAKGGAELFYERLCIAQHHQGLDVLPVIRKNSQRQETLSKAGLKPVPLKFGGKFDWQTKRCLRYCLKTFAPAVAVAWMSRAAYFMPKGDWVTVGRLGGFYDLKYYGKCDHLIGNTRGIVEWIKTQGWPENRVHYLPNFARDFPETIPNRPECVPGQAPFILALGRLHFNKGFDILIKAMVHLKAIHLVIAGEGEERKSLERLADSLGVSGRVHMPGWIHDVSGMIQACTVLVCSSRHEPLGNVVLEGFAATKPVVALASQGPVELIDPYVNGVLSPLEDPVMLAGSIQDILDRPDLADQLALAGRRKFEREFSQGVVLQQWFRFLSEVKKD